MRGEKGKVQGSLGEKDRKIVENPSERDKETLQAQVKGQGEYFICVLPGPGQRTG